MKNYKVTVVVTAENDEGQRVVVHETQDNFEKVDGNEEIDYNEEHVPQVYRLNLTCTKEL